MLRGSGFDGEGYLASRVMQDPRVQVWQQEATSAWKALLQRANLIGRHVPN